MRVRELDPDQSYRFARAQIDIDDDDDDDNEEKEAEAQVDAKQRDGRYLLVSGNWECNTLGDTYDERPKPWRRCLLLAIASLRSRTRDKGQTTDRAIRPRTRSRREKEKEGWQGGMEGVVGAGRGSARSSTFPSRVIIADHVAT